MSLQAPLRFRHTSGGVTSRPRPLREGRARLRTKDAGGPLRERRPRPEGHLPRLRSPHSGCRLGRPRALLPLPSPVRIPPGSRRPPRFPGESLPGGARSRGGRWNSGWAWGTLGSGGARRRRLWSAAARGGGGCRREIHLHGLLGHFLPLKGKEKSAARASQSPRRHWRASHPHDLYWPLARLGMTSAIRSSYWPV